MRVNAGMSFISIIPGRTNPLILLETIVYGSQIIPETVSIVIVKFFFFQYCQMMTS